MTEWFNDVHFKIPCYPNSRFSIAVAQIVSRCYDVPVFFPLQSGLPDFPSFSSTCWNKNQIFLQTTDKTGRELVQQLTSRKKPGGGGAPVPCVDTGLGLCDEQPVS